MKQPIMIANERGSVMGVALFMMVLLSLLGFAATNTSTIELNIAGNDYRYKRALYQADSGTEVGREILEQNINCPLGFASDDLGIDNIVVSDKDFWLQKPDDMPTDFLSDLQGERDIHFPQSDDGPHTNVTAFGETFFMAGAANPMNEGGEGVAKSSASGGAFILYEIYSQHENPTTNTESVVMLQWRSVGGSPGGCNH